MLQRGAVVAVLVVVVALGVVPDGASTHDGGWCARSLDTIKIGTGNAGIDQDLLHGVNHFDVPHPACSSGRYFIDHSTQGVLTEQHCDEKFLRVYAPVGAVGQKFIINWVSGDGCV